MVRVEVAVPEPGVMLAGEKAQLRVLGRFGQESEIGKFDDPDCAVALTVTLADLPAGTLTDVGAAPKEIEVCGGPGAIAGQVEL
jgi:hypothetical protein